MQLSDLNTAYIWHFLSAACSYLFDHFVDELERFGLAWTNCALIKLILAKRAKMFEHKFEMAERLNEWHELEIIALAERVYVRDILQRISSRAFKSSEPTGIRKSKVEQCARPPLLSAPAAYKSSYSMSTELTESSLSKRKNGSKNSIRGGEPFKSRCTDV